MKRIRHLGVYGIVIEDSKVLLIKKYGGPYDGKLDFPGGKIEFAEEPCETLEREFLEETGLSLRECSLFDSDSIVIEWLNNEELECVHHIGIFYDIKNYTGKINDNVKIDNNNDDALYASFYTIDNLKKDCLSNTVIIELEKKGYKLSD